MEFIGIGVFGLAMLVVQAAFSFAIAYFATRLAIRHERRSST